MPSRLRPIEAAPALIALVPAAILAALLAWVWAARLRYPFDLEWMEGGVLAHAWRLQQGLPLYVPPGPDFAPFVYTPGYPALLAILAQGFGLSPTLGRAVSVIAILAAAAAVTFGVRRVGGAWPIAIASGAVFLGTYPQAGAFYDIVRGDALEVALLGWSIAIGRERRPVLAGLLLFAAFLVKQNSAVFGLPLAATLLARDRSEGIRFAASALLPAIAAIVGLEVWSSGAFLVWMLEVPRHHLMTWSRLGLEIPREWGTALPVPLGALAFGWVIRAVRDQDRVPPWIAAAVPVWTGMLALAWWGYAAPEGGQPLAYGVGYWAMAAAPLALAISVIGRTRMSWEVTYETAVVVTAGLTALVMRVHDSGFVNVHAPLFWCLAWAFGCAAARLAERVPVWRWAVAVGLAAQLGWSTSLVRPAALIPTDADLAAGWRFVDEIRAVDGPVLSPFAAWLPTYAGKPPSLHAMGVWDCNFPGGPYYGELATIDRAVADHRWAMIVGGTDKLLAEFTRDYAVEREILSASDRTLTPKTGYFVRPWRILVPETAAEP